MSKIRLELDNDVELQVVYAAILARKDMLSKRLKCDNLFLTMFSTEERICEKILQMIEIKRHGKPK
jgi:hypothetical protein